MTGVSDPTSSRPPSPELVLRQGPQPERRFSLNKPAMTIGRETGNDIVIGDAEVSRRHASLIWDGNHWIIEDLGSANGTVVNGTRITGPKVLERGDVIGLARVVTLELETPVAGPVPAPPDRETMASAYPSPPPQAAPAAATHVPSPAPGSGSTACIVIPLVVLLGLGIVLVAAAAAGYYYLQRGPAPQPVVLIREPRGGDELGLGEEVMVRSVARDPQKIRRVELWVDGELKKAETSKVRGGTSPFPLLVRWQPDTAGSHTLLARAFSSKGALGQASVKIEVTGKTDSDKDGVSDETDVCRDTPGSETADGCPDMDIDGVPDEQDACPEEPGLLESWGCPSPREDDRDGDGLLDVADACPDRIGPPLAGGCPDFDRDGVLDAEDTCPDQAGLPERAGCPPPDDRDVDGVSDALDVCPDQRGEAQHEGCPDRDGDGVRDLDDECPGDRGEAQLGGCPDQDRDGVPDRVDPCPHQAGPAEWHGCPDNGVGDRDDDGIPDDGDLNPGEWGPPENGGAPGPGEGRDEDDDGIADNEEGPDDPLGRINIGGLVAEVMNAAEFQALEFEVDQDYDGLCCYASLAGSPTERYGYDLFQSLGGRRWNIAEVMGGENALHLVVPEGEPLEVDVECLASVRDPQQRVQSTVYELGRITREHPPVEWDGEVISAESEGGDEGHSFRVKYRICPGTCEPTGLAPPMIAMQEALGEMRLYWIWEGDRNGIDGFNVYVDNNRIGAVSSDAHSYPMGQFQPPCGGVTYRYHMTAYRSDEESPPSNFVPLTSEDCVHTLRVTFDTLRTGDLGRITGPVTGAFSAGGESGPWPLLFQSTGFQLRPRHDYQVQQIFDSIRAAGAACRGEEVACPPNIAPDVDYVTIGLGPGDALEYGGHLGETDGASLFTARNVMLPRDIAPGEETLNDGGIEVRVRIEEIAHSEGDARGGGGGRGGNGDEVEDRGARTDLPDLVVSGCPTAGTRQITLRNVGTGGIEDTSIQFDLVDPEDRELVIPASTGERNLPGGGSVSVDIPPDLPLPSPVEVIADPNDLILERDEDNNATLCASAEELPIYELPDDVDLPDLRIVCDGWEDGALWYDLRNDGAAPVASTSIHVAVVDPQNDQVVFAFGATNDLPAGSTAREEIPPGWRLPNPARLVVDPNGLIAEQSENNNDSLCPRAALPDLKTQSDRWEGDRLASFEIVNLGEGDVQGTDIYVHVLEDPGNPRSVNTLGTWGRDLPAGGSITVDVRSIQLSSPVAFVVDPNHLIEEENEDNNYSRFALPGQGGAGGIEWSALPDLSIGEVIVWGDSQQLRIEVHNDGADLVDTPIEIRVERMSTDDAIDQPTWTDLTILSGRSRQVQTMHGGFERNDLRIIVDPEDNIVEQREYNNVWESPADEPGNGWELRP